MGTRFLRYYRENIKKRWKIAFWSTLVIGVIVHLFKFVNVLPNGDALMNFYNSQNMVASGRWLLGVACELGSRFDLPWVNGLLSLFFAGLAAAVVSEHFRMENPCLIVLSSGLLISFPAMTFTFAYEYTADGYMIAMLLAAVGALLTRVENIRRERWKQLALGSACICLACGIYQAYVSFAFALAVCDAILELLEGKHSVKKILTWLGIELLIYGAALVVYYGIWKLCLFVQGVQVTPYHGIDSAGQMSAGALGMAVYKIVRDCFVFFFQWNPFVYGVTAYSVLNFIFLIALAGGIGYAAWKGGALKSKARVALIVLCIVSLPFGCFIWHFLSSDVFYHGVMLQSLSILYIFMAVLYERWVSVRKADLAMVLLSAIIFNNSVSANIFYNHLHMIYERTYATVTEMSTRVHLLDDGTVRNIAICGKPAVWEEAEVVDPAVLRRIGGSCFLAKDLTSYQFMMLYTDFDLAYYRISGEEHPVMELYEDAPVPFDHQFHFPSLPIAEKEALEGTEEFAQMPVWPAEGSVRRIGDTIVVKLSQ